MYDDGWAVCGNEQQRHRSLESREPFSPFQRSVVSSASGKDVNIVLVILCHGVYDVDE